MIYLESYWSAKPLSELVKRVTGVTYKKSQASEDYVEGYVPLLKANNIKDNQILFDEFIYVPPGLVKDEKKIQKNDILIAASSGSLSVVGKAAQVKEDWNGSFGAFCKVLRPDAEKVDARYLAYFFHTGYYRSVISHLAAGANINNINNSHFDELFVPLPPLEIQKKIAAVLDKANALRQKRRQTIEKLDELTQSVFLDMFGDPVRNPMEWERKKLSEVTAKITDGEHVNPEFTEKGAPIVLAQNVKKEGVDLKKSKRITKEDNKKFRRKCDPNFGDILIVSRGATIGRTTVININEAFSLMGSVILVKPDKSKLTSGYLNSLLNHPSFQHKLINTSSSSAQQAIYLTHLREMEVPIPKIQKQEVFQKKLLKVLSLRENLKENCVELDNLFNSLLQKAFKGELNFQETENPALAAEAGEEFRA